MRRAAWANVESSTRALKATRLEAEAGKGPSAKDLERITRRQGRDNGSYTSAVARLEALAGKHNGHHRRPGDDLAERLLALPLADGRPGDA